MDQKKKKGLVLIPPPSCCYQEKGGGEAIKWSSSAVLANIDFSSFFFAISYGFAGSRIGLPCARGDWRLRGKAQRLRQMVAMATAVWEYLFIPIKYNDSLTCRALQKRTANSSRPCKNNSWDTPGCGSSLGRAACYTSPSSEHPQCFPPAVSALYIVCALNNGRPVAHASWFQKPYSIQYVYVHTLCSMYRSQNVGNNTQRPFSDSDNNKRHAFSTHAGPPSSFPLVDWVAVQPQSVGGGGDTRMWNGRQIRMDGETIGIYSFVAGECPTWFSI